MNSISFDTVVKLKSLRLFVLPKKVNDIQKQNIKEMFSSGYLIKEISDILNFSIPTITKQLKTIFGEEKFKKIKNNFKKENSEVHFKSDYIDNSSDTKSTFFDSNSEKKNDDDSQDSPFFEILPLTDGVEFEKQKDITTQSLESINLPSVLYMIINSKIELEPKLLKEYPEWSFLPEEDLNRITLEIFADQKIAKRSCGKNQKLIKIPNPNVFLIASSQIKAKGISRIVFDNLLLSL